MPELTVPGLVLISLLPFIIAAVWAFRAAAREWTRTLTHQDQLALERSERDRKDWVEGFVTQSAVEAVVAAEEWARRVGYHDLAKTEYATTRLAEMLKAEGMELPHEELVKRTDAALTRVRPGLQDEPSFVGYPPDAGQEPTQQTEEPSPELLAEYHRRMDEKFASERDQSYRDAAAQSAD